MRINISEILSFLGDAKFKYEYSGKADFFIEGFCPLSELKPKSITWIKEIESFDFSTINAPLNLLIVTTHNPSVNCDVSEYNFIHTDNPKVVYFEILRNFFAPPQKTSHVASSAVIETSNIGSNVSIGHNCYICKDVTIGDNVTIKNNVVIECPTKIGSDCNIESGVIIGSSGYGYYTHNDKRPKQVPEYGGVIIGDRVSIGSNTCIARGTLSDTIIEDDVKIDNLCHIAHNVFIGARSYVIALSMIAGSCVIGEDVHVAPGALIMDQKTIGKNSIVGLGAVVTKSVDANKVVAGVPAKVIRDKG